MSTCENCGHPYELTPGLRRCSQCRVELGIIDHHTRRGSGIRIEPLVGQTSSSAPCVQGEATEYQDHAVFRRRLADARI